MNAARRVMRHAARMAAAWTPLLLVLLLCPRRAAAQCPDGTPPPCARAAQRAARVVAPPPEARARRFLVLPFRNLSRTPELEWLVEGSTAMLGDALVRWQEITVVPDDRLYPALARNGLTPGAVMAQPLVRRVAEQTGGWTAVTGELVEIRGGARVSARAYDVVTGRELVRAVEEVTADGDVRAAFERIGAALLRTAGLDTASVDLGAVTTRSLAAYRMYLRGLGHANRSEFQRAAEAFAEATRLDSTFAQAYYQLSYALLFTDPMSVFDSTSALLRAAERAIVLADRLPPRMRDPVLGLGALVQGRFGSAYRLLEPLVAADSGNIDALASLAFLHYIDPILVSNGHGGYHRRGSLNAHLALARRILALNPARHDVYLNIVTVYLLAAGDVPGVTPGLMREGPSFAATFLAMPVQALAPLLLSDTLAMVPLEVVDTMPPAVVAAARRRAVDAAREWNGRWLAAGPTEGEAYRAAAKIAEMSGDPALALAHAARAEALGSEVLGGTVALWRVGLLGRLRRWPDAIREADAAWRSGRLAAVTPAPTDGFTGAMWAFNLFLMNGEIERAESLVVRYGARLRETGFAPTPGLAEPIAVRLLSGIAMRPYFPQSLPIDFRIAALESLTVRRGPLPAVGPVGRLLPTMADLLAKESEGDSALTARVAALPWRRRS